MDTSRQTIWRSLLSPVFVVSAFIVAGMAIGLRPVVGALREHYRKESISLRRPLAEFDFFRLPSFREGKMELGFKIPYQDIGTDELMIRPVLEKGGGAGSRPTLLFVTYYSDPDDTVPHTPDVCYRQGGAVIMGLSTIKLDVPGLEGQEKQIEVRLVRARQPQTDRAIIFVFYANGRFYVDRNQVRWSITWPGYKYVYFSKIEATATFPRGSDASEAIERCKKLMSEVVPVLLAEHYPRTEDLKRR